MKVASFIGALSVSIVGHGLLLAAVVFTAGYLSVPGGVPGKRGSYNGYGGGAAVPSSIEYIDAEYIGIAGIESGKSSLLSDGADRADRAEDPSLDGGEVTMPHPSLMATLPEPLQEVFPETLPEKKAAAAGIEVPAHRGDKADNITLTATGPVAEPVEEPLVKGEGGEEVEVLAGIQPSVLKDKVSSTALTARGGGGESSPRRLEPGGPVLLGSGKPHYPRRSRILKEEGRVLLQVLVGGSGRAESVEVTASSGFRRLDRSALRFLRRASFAASGPNKPYMVNYAYTFRLDGSEEVSASTERESMGVMDSPAGGEGVTGIAGMEGLAGVYGKDE